MTEHEINEHNFDPLLDLFPSIGNPISICVMIAILLCFLELCFDFFSCHTRAHNDIPVNEEGLCKVFLDTNCLMMNVVIVCIVTEEELEWVER